MAAMRALAGKRIGFVGGGAMAEALIGGLRAAGIPAGLLRASDPDPGRRKLLAEAFGLEAHSDNADVVAESDLLVLAVKPQVVEGALRSLPDRDLARPLWVSIAAGIPISKLANLLPEGARIVRAMPNTPALVRAGATAICAGRAASGSDREAATALFETVGVCWEAQSESLLDAVTGLSGSGPAYVFVFLEALGDAGVRMGLPRDAAYRLAFQTVLGAAKLAQETGRTTIAGLERLEAGGFRAAVYEAVAAATLRSRELAGS
jgi:pyrroline-5-carboxylate reductase